MKPFLLLQLFIIFLTSSLFSVEPDLTQQSVATAVRKNSSVFAADMDNDGYKDIVGNSYYYNDLYWWKNDGADQSAWSRSTIDSDFEGPQYVFVADIDGDGRNDVLATGSVEASRVAWWHNDGGDPVGWTREIIRENFGNAHGIYAKDINGDGKMDILASAAGDSLICWWENSGSFPDIEWTEHLVDSSAAGCQCVMSSDIDRDGDNDIIASVGNKVMLYVNAGGSGTEWTPQPVDNSCAWSHWVDTADFNNDGHVDIISANYSENYLKWYENNGADPIGWTEHTVSGIFPLGLTVCTADINNDGFMDIAGTAMDASPTWCDISWWENNGGEEITFTKHTLQTSFTYPWGLFIADMDNDNDNDLVVGSNYLHRVIWFENSLYANAIEDQPEDGLFRTFSLLQNYPNPFNPSTTIHFSVKEAGPVQLMIYNVEGQRVNTLVDESKMAGIYQVEWDGTDLSGNKVSSGIYFYRMTAGALSETRRMVLVK